MWNKRIILIIIALLISYKAIPDYLEKADKFYQSSKFDSALYYYNLAINNISGNQVKQLANIYSKIGIVHEDLGNYQQALKYYNNSLKYYQMANDSLGISDAYNQIGNIYYRWSDFENAIKYYLKSLSIKQKRNEIGSLPSSYNNIGNIYYSWKKYNKALEYFNKALKIKEEQNDSTELASYLLNIGSAYLGLSQYDKVKEYYFKALDFSRRSGNEHMQASCLINIGVLYFEQKEYSKAIMYYLDAKDIIDRTGNKLEKAFIHRNLGETYLQINDLRNSTENLQIALNIAVNENLNELKSELYYLLFKVEKAKNNYELALAYHELYSDIKDSIFNIQSSKKLNELQSKYEYERKENEIKQKNLIVLRQKKQIQIQQLIFAISATCIVIVFLFIYFKLKNRELKKRIILEKELGQQKQKLLSAQMNPHFISNALNSIQKFFLKNDIEKANEYLADFGALIRIILENSQKDSVLLTEEIKFLELYASLEALRLNNKFNFNIDIPDEIDISDIKVPPMILQPFIENAIWHGIAPLDKLGEIKVSISKINDNTILCKIEDNGIGYTKSKDLNKKYQVKRKSYGVNLTKERLNLLNKSNKNLISLKIIDKSELGQNTTGTIVELYLSV
ncbi:MAG: hypothetical protein Kow0068_16960 [Marinilabiliales bacterium]